MKTKQFIQCLMVALAILCVPMAFTACSDDDDKEDVHNYTLTVANKDYDVNVLFDGLHSVITEVKNVPTWLTVTPQTTLNSDGAPEVIIKVQATEEDEERKCNLHLTTASNEQAVLTVTQSESDSDDENHAYSHSPGSHLK